jgi:hypothetical protein
MSSEKLNRALGIICDSDSISEKELPFQRLTSAFNVDAPDLNSYPLKVNIPTILGNKVNSIKKYEAILYQCY